MRYILSKLEMQGCDRFTIESIKIPSMVLMERAALQVRDILINEKIDLSHVLILCGGGNNGGDGAALARMFYLMDIDVDVLMLSDSEHFSNEMKTQMQILPNYDVRILKDIPDKNYTVIIDAIFGVGLSRNIEGKYLEAINKVNNIKASKIAIDIPSGVDADTGKIMGTAFRADITVTIAYNKKGMLLYPATLFCGKIITADIGISDISFDGNIPKGHILEKSDIKLLPQRIARSNKGTFGKVLVIAGSLNMTGAAYFSGAAAYLLGAGFVKIFTPECNKAALQTLLPEAVMSFYDPCNIDMDQLEYEVGEADSIIVGPGIGVSESSELLTKYVIENAKVPVVVDGDALNIISKDLTIFNKKKSTIIVTPHLKEMSRLIKQEVEDIKDNMIDTAADFSKKYKIICVLKDAKTITSFDDGRFFINTTGNNGMSTAGAGDVLTGIIGALVAVSDDYFKMAALAVFIHGLAGDAAKKKNGVRSLMARDILDGIREVLLEI